MTFLEADRAVSVTVTHILALAITTILISGLLLGAGSLLDSERHRSTQGSLETIGERLAGEVAGVDRIDPQGGEQVSVTTNHPTLVTGSKYTVELLEPDDCEDGDYPLIDVEVNCLVLTDQDEDVEVAIPLRIDADVGGDNEANGGSIEIVLDGDEISLQDGDS